MSKQSPTKPTPPHSPAFRFFLSLLGAVGFLFINPLLFGFLLPHSAGNEVSMLYAFGVMVLLLIIGIPIGLYLIIGSFLIKLLWRLLTFKRPLLEEGLEADRRAIFILATIGGLVGALVGVVYSVQTAGTLWSASAILLLAEGGIGGLLGIFVAAEMEPI